MHYKRKGNEVIVLKSIKAGILLLATCLVLLSGCTGNSEELKVIELSHPTEFSYNEGISIEDATAEVSRFYNKESNNIPLEEYTTNGLWKNNQMQVFRVSIDFAWVDSLAVFINGELVHVLDGQSITRIVLSDLNSDGIYELCMTSNFGSGFVRSVLKVYESTEDKEYEYTYVLDEEDPFSNQDVRILPNFDENEVDVYIHDWSNYKIEIILADEAMQDNDLNSSIESSSGISTDYNNIGELIGKLRLEDNKLSVVSY